MAKFRGRIPKLQSTCLNLFIHDVLDGVKDSQSPDISKSPCTTPFSLDVIVGQVTKAFFTLIHDIKELENKNCRLKQIYAEERFKSEMRKEALEKSGKAPPSACACTNRD